MMNLAIQIVLVEEKLISTYSTQVGGEEVSPE